MKKVEKVSKLMAPGELKIQAPSNIALVKYWGKKSNQISLNPSVSFTLSKSVTDINFCYREKEDQKSKVEVILEGALNVEFSKRVEKYFDSIKQDFPFLELLDFNIYSKNSFPHSAGIASSASSFSGISIALNLLKHLIQPYKDKFDFMRSSSNFARLGSGSASRSIYGGFNFWGEHQEVKNSSNLWAKSIDKIHAEFSDLQDSILLVDSKPKSVSSSKGHELMENHVFSNERFQMAKKNAFEMLNILETGEWERFVEIVEEEALTLHGLMMTSRPNFILLKPNTLRIIELIKEHRSASLPICFTMDAGPNIHLIYPKRVKRKVVDFIKHELEKYLENGCWIDDEVGAGPEFIYE